MIRVRTNLDNTIVSFLDRIQLAPKGVKVEGLREEVDLTPLEFEHPSVQEALRRGRITVINTGSQLKDTGNIAEIQKTPKIKEHVMHDPDMPAENADVNVVPDMLDVVAPKAKKGK